MNEILKISSEKNLSHIGSSLGVYSIMREIYGVKREEDIIVLDEAHGALGYYVALEEFEGKNARELFDKHGVHQNRDTENNIHVSGGSLGLAGAVGLGMAIGKPDRDVYCITSDGALNEGIWWETLRLKTDLHVTNYKVYVNANGWGAYDPIDIDKLEARLMQFDPDIQVRRFNSDFGDIKGLDAHYKTWKG